MENIDTCRELEDKSESALHVQMPPVFKTAYIMTNQLATS